VVDPALFHYIKKPRNKRLITTGVAIVAMKTPAVVIGIFMIVIVTVIATVVIEIILILVAPLRAATCLMIVLPATLSAMTEVAIPAVVNRKVLRSRLAENLSGCAIPRTETIHAVGTMRSLVYEAKKNAASDVGMTATIVLFVAMMTPMVMLGGQIAEMMSAIWHWRPQLLPPPQQLLDPVVMTRTETRGASEAKTIAVMGFAIRVVVGELLIPTK